MGRLTPKCIKILKTCNLYLCFISLGLCVAVPGPCLLDLQHVIHTDTQHIAFIYTARSVGYLLGAVVGGIILDAVKSKQTVMIVCNFLVGSSMLAIPWSRSLGALTGYMAVNGLALGAVDTGGNVLCLTLWGSDSGPFYQALHFTFGLGGLVAPLIAAPFLGDYSEEVYLPMDGDNSTYPDSFTNFTTEFMNYNNSELNDSIPRIIYPFSIIGGFSQLVTLTFLAIRIASPEEKLGVRYKSTQSVNTGMGFICTVVFLNFLLLFVETGTEVGYAQMLTTYVVKGRLKLTSTTGSYMTSTFWAAFTISRLASIFLAIKISSFTLIIYDLAITLVGSFVLLFLATYEWALWLASILLGMGIASFYPAAVAWLDTYINVTNKIASIFSVGVAVGEMSIPFTISYFIETVPDVLIYVVPVSSISSSLIVLILYFILKKRPKKYVSEEPECLEAISPTVNT